MRFAAPTRLGYRPALMARRQFRCLGVAALLAALQAACGSSPTAPQPPTPPPALPSVPIMGASRLSAGQIVAWFGGRQPQPPGAYAATEPVEVLARYFVEEGAMEGVTGDVAFVQSVIETGWFRFTGAVPAWKNNFAGIGAVDASPGEAAAFPDARTGGRAQIQHLRAYADPSAVTCAVPPLTSPCVDPRFHLVVPKGRAPFWNQLGGGAWASAPSYGTDIVTRYQEALAYHGLRR
jgi:hypothetical protein